MVLLALVADAFAADRVLMLPAGEDPRAWREAASLAEVVIGQCDRPVACVTLRHTSAGWSLEAPATGGGTRVLPVRSPSNEGDREEITSLAASLLDELATPSSPVAKPPPPPVATVGVRSEAPATSTPSATPATPPAHAAPPAPPGPAAPAAPPAPPGPAAPAAPPAPPAPAAPAPPTSPAAPAAPAPPAALTAPTAPAPPTAPTAPAPPAAPTAPAAPAAPTAPTAPAAPATPAAPAPSATSAARAAPPKPVPPPRTVAEAPSRTPARPASPPSPPASPSPSASPSPPASSSVLSVPPGSPASPTPPAATPPAPTTVGEPPVSAWLDLSPAASFRAGASAGGAVAAGGGVRWRSVDLGARVGWWAPRPLDATDGSGSMSATDLALTARWVPDRPVAPLAALSLGASWRGFRDGTTRLTRFGVPFVDLHAGASFRLATHLALSPFAAGRVDLATITIKRGSADASPIAPWDVGGGIALVARIP